MFSAITRGVVATFVAGHLILPAPKRLKGRHDHERRAVGSKDPVNLRQDVGVVIEMLEYIEGRREADRSVRERQLESVGAHRRSVSVAGTPRHGGGRHVQRYEVGRERAEQDRVGGRSGADIEHRPANAVGERTPENRTQHSATSSKPPVPVLDLVELVDQVSIHGDSQPENRRSVSERVLSRPTHEPAWAMRIAPARGLFAG